MWFFIIGIVFAIVVCLVLLTMDSIGDSGAGCGCGAITLIIVIILSVTFTETALDKIKPTEVKKPLITKGDGNMIKGGMFVFYEFDKGIEKPRYFSNFKVDSTASEPYLLQLTTKAEGSFFTWGRNSYKEELRIPEGLEIKLILE